MKISQLRYFQAVCQYNNITRASEALYVSQPAISASIKELEDELGVALFHRQNNKITLTMEGTYFLQQAEEILAKVDAVILQMKDFGGKKKQFRIGVPPMIGTFLFPPMFREFKTLHPDIAIEIFEHGSLQTRVLVEDESLDLAIAVVEEGMEQTFEIVDILETELVFCVSKTSPLSKKKKLDIEDLRDQPIILMKADSFQNPKIKALFSRHGIEPHVLLYSSQLYTIKKFITDGLAGAFVFREVAEMDDELVAIPLAEPIPVRIGLIYKKAAHLFSDTGEFVRFAKNFKYRTAR